MIVETVKIPISGLTQKYAFFHISDTHMRYSADEATQNTEVFQRASNLKARECFEKIVDRVRREDAVGLFITGDCLEGVHDNAAYFRRVTDSCGKDILYVLGNHETSRFEYREDLAALLPGNPMYWVKDYGEFLVVGIDNTNRVLRPEQIDFLKKQAARGLPILLLMHIPIYTHENDHALRVRWGGDGHDLFSLGLENTVPETMEFIKMIRSEESHIAAIFAGHAHFAHVGEFAKGRLQVIAAPIFEEHAWRIELCPADSTT